jgi:uncharacterized membrane protein
MKKFLENLNLHNIAVISALSAFFLGLLLILFGFWKTLFLILITLVGYYFGKKFLSNKEELKKLLDRILPPGRFR